MPSLVDQPAPARDALRPGKPIRAVLELEDERRRKEDADQSGDQVEPGEQDAERLEAVVKVSIAMLQFWARRPRQADRPSWW